MRVTARVTRDTIEDALDELLQRADRARLYVEITPTKVLRILSEAKGEALLETPIPGDGNRRVRRKIAKRLGDAVWKAETDRDLRVVLRVWAVEHIRELYRAVQRGLWGNVLDVTVGRKQRDPVSSRPVAVALASYGVRHRRSWADWITRPGSTYIAVKKRGSL